MKKQKICIIGGGLTGLATAISLSKLNCEIDLIIGDTNLNSKSNSTIAVSKNNFNFLNKLKISKSFKKEIWPCSDMKLYTEIKNKNYLEIFELNNNSNILYMFENSKIIKLMMSKIKKTQSIKIKDKVKVSSVSRNGILEKVKLNNNTNNYKYNLVIICAGYNSSLVKDIFNDRVIENSYKELAVTTILSHNKIKNNIVRQIFLDNEILALLPISNTKTSIVWSVKSYIRKKNNLFLKNKIKFYAKKYLKNIKFASNIEYRDLKFVIRNKYYLNRTLLFGDALHVVHPFVGQGFNMVLRDLACLEKLLEKKISLGLDIGSNDILSEFSREIKPRNFAFSVGVDLLKNSFMYKNFRNNTLKILNKSNLVKDIFFNIADKGFKF